MKEKVNFKEVFIEWDGKRYYLNVRYHAEGGGALMEVGRMWKVDGITHTRVYWAEALKNLSK